MGRKYVPTDSKMLNQKVLSLYKDFGKDSLKTSNTKPSTACNGSYTYLTICLS